MTLSIWLAFMLPWIGVSRVFALGAAPCSELFQKNRWQGQQSSTTSERHGAKGVFESWSLVQCTNPGLFEISGSFVFSNVIPTNGSFNDIIQVGAGTCRAPICSGGMHYLFAAGLTHTTPGCSTYQDTTPLPNEAGSWTGTTHTYTVQHSGNLWRLMVDGVAKANYAEAAICWTPRSSIWFGESWDYGDQIGGIPVDHMTISGTQYMPFEGAAWFNTTFAAANPCNYAASSPPFQCDVTGAQSLDFWTTLR
jgi:hypothetical protein